jgi:RHS repeat-associated protein
MKRLILLFCGFVCFFVQGQISGPPTVTAGQTYSYSFSSATVYYYYHWSINPPENGTVMSTSTNGTVYSADIKWNNGGSATLTFNGYGQPVGSPLNITINCPTVSQPSTTFTYSTNTCGPKTITASGSAPAGLTWYWQTSSSGTSKSFPGNVYTATTSGTYYLRANCNNTWSTATATTAVTVNSPTPPTVSPAPGGITYTTNACGYQTLTKSNSSWYWQGNDPNGTATGGVNLADNYTATVTGMYYIRAFNDTCWGTATGVSITVDAPAAPNNNTYNICEWDPMTFTTSGYSANLKWYDGSNNLLHTGTSYSVNLNAGATVFNVKSVSPLGCISTNNGTVTVTVNNNCDTKLNWTQSTAYGLDGSSNPIVSGASKTYSDGFGNPLQAQSYSVVNNQVFASQPLNDRFNQAVGSTMGAPINSSTFGYRHRFMTNATNLKYNANDFDIPQSTNAAGEVNNPKPVANGGIGSLGWYYSSANTLEPRTPTTAFPYSRSYVPPGPDPTTSTAAGVGENNKMGSGHEGKSDRYTFTYAELGHYYKLRHHFVSGGSGAEKGPGVYPIQGNITVQPGTTYKFRVKASATGQPAALYVGSRSLNSDIVWGPTVPTTEGYVETTFTVPMQCTDIFLGVRWTGAVGSSLSVTETLITQVSNTVNTSVNDTRVVGYKVVSTDPDGKRAVSFTDIDGRTLASALVTGGTAPNFNYDYWSYTYYNDLGEVLATVPPNGVNTGSDAYPNFATTFKYDHLGQLIETTSVDEGTSRYVYSTDGKIRFSQNQEQRNATPQRFSYTNYDNYGRLVESGEYTMSGSGYYVFEITSASAPVSNSVLNIVDNDLARGLDIDGVTPSPVNYTGISAKLDPTRCTDYNYILYDKQSSDLPPSGVPAGDTFHGTQTYMLGEVSKTQNAITKTWYSYDEFGQLLWTKQLIPDLLPNSYKTVDYTYDYFGNVTKVEYQKNQSDAYNHFYVYDADQRLIEAYSTTAATYTPATDVRAKYFYYLHGPLKRVELANSTCKQGVDYVYTVDGGLKSINSSDPANDPGGDNVTSTPDFFGETLHYNDTDYTGASYSPPSVALSSGTYPNSYSGSLRAMAYNNATDKSSGTTNARHLYAYQYDDRNQLANAQYGSLSGSTPTFGEAQREQIPGYDKNGNIQNLVRKGKQAQTIGNYSYQYESNTNKVDYINHNGTPIVDYAYNAIGQMTRQNESVFKDFKVTYTPYGLVKDVLDYDTGYLIQQYFYDDRGDLIKKATYKKGTPLRNTWYVNDASGNSMAIYEQALPGGSIQQTEVPVYGAGRLGVYKPQVTAYRYEVTDHLGNVRAVCGQLAPANYLENFEGATSAHFNNYNNVFINNNMDHTDLPGDTYQKIQQLNGNANGRVGISKSLEVSPGDQVSISAWVKYLAPSGTANPNAFITALASAFGVSSVSTGEAEKIFSGLNSFAALVPNGDHPNDDETPPKAFVTILLFDKNYVLQDATWDQVSTAGASTHDLLSATYTVKQPGYAYFFVSNEHPTYVDTYFDDVTVSHTQSPIVSGSDYYPFGLVMDGMEITDEKYRHGYQGQFSEKDLTTGWNEFELRMYDARFGRWLSIDPYGQFASPYLAMGNNPALGVDPDGGWFLADALANMSATVSMMSGIYAGTINAATRVSLSSARSGGYAIEFGMSGGLGAAGGVGAMASASMSVTSLPDMIFTAARHAPTPLSTLINFGSGLLTEMGNIAGAGVNITGSFYGNIAAQFTDNPYTWSTGGFVRHWSQERQAGFYAGLQTAGEAVVVSAATAGAGELLAPAAAPFLRAIKFEQYALRVNQTGFYPVMKRGYKQAQELVWLEKGDVWKFGTTMNPFKRYSQRYLDEVGEYGVSYVKEFEGTLKQVRLLEKMKILNHRIHSGLLPAGNKIVK